MRESFLTDLFACGDSFAAAEAASSTLAGNRAVTAVFATALVLILCFPSTRRLGVLAGYGVVVALTMLLLPAIDSAREAARRSSCNCNLKQFGIALHNYLDTYGCLPPAYIADSHGRPMHSWRVLLLPYLEGKQIFQTYDFNEPWDGPHNRLLADQMPKSFRCPSDSVSKPGETSYALVVGPATMWPEGDAIPFRNVSDGSENTLAIVEVAGAGIHWMEPRDVPINVAKAGIGKAPKLGICSRHPGGVQAVFADGSVHFLNETISQADLEALITPADGKVRIQRDP